MSIAAMRARPIRTTSLTLDEWIEDATWHRRMYRQSRFRWMPEDPFHVATRFTRGRVLHETPLHLAKLNDQIMALRDHRGEIRDAMAPRLDQVKQATGGLGERWSLCLELMGLDQRVVDSIQRSAVGRPRPESTNHDVQRALRGFPSTNPITEVWELRQIESMYDAGDHLLEDTFCDLAGELAERLGWDFVATYSWDLDGLMLQRRVDWQRSLRGEPGDPRRSVEQTYPPMPAVQLVDDW